MKHNNLQKQLYQLYTIVQSKEKRKKKGKAQASYLLVSILQVAQVFLSMQEQNKGQKVGRKWKIHIRSHTLSAIFMPVNLS